MSGICGFTGSFSGREDAVKRMKDKMADNQLKGGGVFFDENVCLNFSGENVLNIEDGAQPMQDSGGSIFIVYSGEIYNSGDLRDSLINDGYEFKTNSGAEILINLYKRHSFDFMMLIRGIFSFMIWDKKEGLLFGARDYFGVKPLYYTVVNGNLAFSSEIMSVVEYPYYKPQFNEEALENYLSFQYSVLPETFYKGVFRLPPAHYFIFKNGELSVTRYWEPKFEEDKTLTKDVAVEKIKNTVADSVKVRMTAGNEIGSFLSSGVDSSYVTAIFGGNKTFTVGFQNDKFNEPSYAKRLAKELGVENYCKIITDDEYWDSLPAIMNFMGEPLADPSAVALYFASKLASEHVRVALSGEGADELFGGYNIYREPLSLAPMNVIPYGIRRLIGKLASLLPFTFKGKNYLIRAGKTVENRFIGNAYMFTKKDRDKVLINPKVKYAPECLTKPYYDKVKHMDDVAKMQYIDIHFWMTGDILLKANRMSAAHSLVLRTPLLDLEVFRLAMSLPARLKVGREGTKLAFRAAAAERLPKETAEKKKLGFPVPLRAWLKEDKFYERVKNEFINGKGARFFNKNEILRLLDEHKRGSKDNSRKVWTIYIFLVWYSGICHKFQ